MIAGRVRHAELCRTDELDAVVHVDAADAVRMCRSIAAEFGLLIGGLPGSVLAAVSQYQSKIPAEAPLVAISLDPGKRYLDGAYDDWGDRRIRCRRPERAAQANAGDRPNDAPPPSTETSAAASYLECARNAVSL